MSIFTPSYYNNQNKRSSTSKTGASGHKTRSQSFSSFSNILEQISPTGTMTSSSSSYSLHHSANNMTRSSHTDISNTSNGSHSKRFHSSQLGRPPGSNTRFLQKPPILQSPSSTTHQQLPIQRNNSTMKIAPMKEVEKMITDLKKENFDLKLRLYHLEDLMTKELDIYQLNEENARLKMSLEDQNKYINGLERELTSVLHTLGKRNDRPVECSVGIQTEEELLLSPIISPATQAITDDSYHTAFESSPEAFGLLPVSSSSLSLVTPVDVNISNKKKPSNRKLSILGSWQIKANDDHISSVVRALQKVKLDNSNINNNNISDKDTNIVDKWLNQNVSDHQQGNLSYPIS